MKAKSATQRGHVLVVEDDESMRQLLWLHLSEAGYAVTLAEDAIVGGQHILRSPPDLVLLDVDMPFMSGIELAACMAADRTVPLVPIVFFTGNEHIADKAAMFGAGVLLKPCTKTRLLEMVRTHIKGAAAEQAPTATPRHSIGASGMPWMFRGRVLGGRA